MLEQGSAAHSMIQDIAPHRYHTEYTPVPIQNDSVILAYRGRTILVRVEENDKAFSYPTYADMADLPSSSFRWLFREDTTHYFLALEDIPEGRGFSYVSINFMRAAQPRFQAFAGVAGLSLHHWYSNHRFCGQCGRPMAHSDDERMVYCQHCHTMIYPRICPAVIVAVRNGDKLLVSTYAGRAYTKIALIAGFAEIGETIEQTVHREVMEEVGIQVKNLQFYKSQPWCFTDTLLFGFFCDLDGDDTLHVDHHELATAQWMDRHDLPEDTEKASLTMEMITLFKQGIW